MPGIESYINQCDDLWGLEFDLVEAVLREHALPSGPDELLAYVVAHPDVWEFEADVDNHGCLSDTLRSIVTEQIRSQVDAWVDTCFYAKLLEGEEQKQTD